jgi:hypothetical protein
VLAGTGNSAHQRIAPKQVQRNHTQHANRRYRTVLDACCMWQDIQNMEALDRTVVGDHAACCVLECYVSRVQRVRVLRARVQRVRVLRVRVLRAACQSAACCVSECSVSEC